MRIIKIKIFSRFVAYLTFLFYLCKVNKKQVIIDQTTKNLSYAR